MNQKLRTIRRSPVDDVTTEVQAHYIYNGSTELIIEQTTFKHFEKRYSPRKLLTILLSPEDRARLIEMLSNPEAHL